MPEKTGTSVKHWPEDERPRERLLSLGASSLSDAQLLAIIIRNGRAGRTAVDLGRELITRFRDFAGIYHAGIKEISQTNGIGPAKAAEIKAAIEIGKRFQLPDLDRKKRASFCSSEDVAKHCTPMLKDEKREIFRCFLLDTKNKVIRDEVVSIGSLSASIVHPRDTFKAAVRESAAAVIFVHNHPSGDVKPSQEDILLTKRLVQSGEVLGIQVLDHIIIGDGTHFSFKDNGLISCTS
jgi:DNA repair protein RadC